MKLNMSIEEKKKLKIDVEVKMKNSWNSLSLLTEFISNFTIRMFTFCFIYKFEKFFNPLKTIGVFTRPS